MTLGAELDGLCRFVLQVYIRKSGSFGVDEISLELRVTRMAESYHFDRNKKDGFNLTTIIIKGMNHYQFAGEGEPPSFVKQNDIQAEISNDAAIDQTSLVINAFMQVALGRNADKEIDTLKGHINDTATLVQDLIDAFLYEGSYHLSQPCLATGQTNCTSGSTWTQSAQVILGGNEYDINATDTFRHTALIPEQYPSLNSKCEPPKPCTLNIGTVSQITYSLEDPFDTGLQAQGADEIRAKMISRQAVILAATGKKIDFNETDGDDKCALLNHESLQWALSKAANKTVQRYLNKGLQLLFGYDIEGGPGAFWLYNPLVCCFFLVFRSIAPEK